MIYGQLGEAGGGAIPGRLARHSYAGAKQFTDTQLGVM